MSSPQPETPTVVNRHWYKTGLPAGATYIGRGTPLGNPFTVAEYGKDALALYRAWLWEKLKQRDDMVLGAMRAIRPDTPLVCSCKPRPCHGDVVVKAWLWLRSQGILEEP